MKFIGENEMILNAETVKAALEAWMNKQRIVDELHITYWKQRENGSVVIKFVTEKEMARRMGGRAQGPTVPVKAGPAEVVPIAGTGPAGAQ